MATRNLVYVHGAGPQPSAADLKKSLDLILFDAPLATSRVARYADVRWSAAGTKLAAAAASGAGRARRQAAVTHAASRTVSPEEAAETIVRAAMSSRKKGPLGAASPANRKAAIELVTEFYKHADRVAHHSSPHALGIGFPDFIFRKVVGFFASDVVDYLFNGFADAMQAEVRKVLLAGPVPEVIIAHSLGTIVTYDVLSDPQLKDRIPSVLVTVGCPLGIDNVQKRLRKGAGRPNPIPAKITTWSNFADRFDPVAIEATLRDEFKPTDLIVDDEVNNRAKNNHDIDGYLSIAVVHSMIRKAVGVA
jgi:hypothetical protein